MLVAISVDDLETSKRLVGTLGLKYPLLGDPDRKVVRAWGVEDAENEIAWPALFVIDKNGTIGTRLMLETYKERPLPEQVLGALQ